MFLMIAGVVIFLIWAYILFARPYLSEKFPSTYGRFAKIEQTLFERSRTILVARSYWFGGLLLSAHELAAAAGLDVTPFISEVSKLIPEGYRGMAVAGFMFVTGLIFAWLRKRTTGPVPGGETV